MILRPWDSPFHKGFRKNAEPPHERACAHAPHPRIAYVTWIIVRLSLKSTQHHNYLFVVLASRLCEHESGYIAAYFCMRAFTVDLLLAMLSAATSLC